MKKEENVSKSRISLIIFFLSLIHWTIKNWNLLKTHFKAYPAADKTVPMRIPRRTSRILSLRSLFDLEISFPWKSTVMSQSILKKNSYLYSFFISNVWLNVIFLQVFPFKIEHVNGSWSQNCTIQDLHYIRNLI